MREDTITQLRKISTPKQFAKDEYICHEGQPGNEMHIILKGSVGVFLTSPIGTLNQVATIEAGSFFGEMAVFDNLPRSASCIALEDTVTVAVTQDNLQEFLETCPDMAKQMLESMSGRIRKLDEELYKNNRFVKNRHVPRFAIPREYQGGHVVKRVYREPRLVTEYKQACPICGKAVSVTELKRNILEVKEFDMDCRIRYAGVNPLWYEIISCPHCYYTNHYLHFFGINNFEFDVVRKILLQEHKPILEARFEKRTDFDYMVIQYLQAIHLNEHINPGGHLLLGSLWRSLYWMSKDVSDRDFAIYCAKKAIEKFQAAIEEDHFLDKTGKASTALSLACMQVFCGIERDIMRIVEIALDCPDERVTEHAAKIKAQLERRMQNEQN